MKQQELIRKIASARLVMLDSKVALQLEEDTGNISADSIVALTKNLSQFSHKYLNL